MALRIVHQGAWENVEGVDCFARETGPLCASAGVARREVQRRPVERSAKRGNEPRRGIVPGYEEAGLTGCVSVPVMADH